jgi:hypothetical protein
MPLLGLVIALGIGVVVIGLIRGVESLLKRRVWSNLDLSAPVEFWRIYFIDVGGPARLAIAKVCYNASLCLADYRNRKGFNPRSVPEEVGSGNHLVICEVSGKFMFLSQTEFESEPWSLIPVMTHEQYLGLLNEAEEFLQAQISHYRKISERLSQII